MININSFFQEKPEVPSWFKGHAVFKDVKQIDKIFPSIGLDNFTFETDIDNTAALNDIIRNLCYSIASYLNSALYRLDEYKYYGYYGGYNLKKPTEAQQACIHLIKKFKASLRPAVIFNNFKKTKGLYIISDIDGIDKKSFIKKGESLFKAYNKLSKFVSDNGKYSLAKLENLQAFKDYSSSNINGKAKIVFSSDGNDGAWDILTMSMRGIQSCQSWTGGYQKCTIGSVIDPHTAIIYMTSGSKTSYGTKMMRRCVVRYAINNVTKKPCLFLEYMYPSVNKEALGLFVKVLQSKVGKKIPVITNTERSNKYYVPYSSITPFLAKHSDIKCVNTVGQHNVHGIFPYRDHFMKYKLETDNQEIFTSSFKKDKNKYFDKLYDVCKNANIKSTYCSSIIKTIIDELVTRTSTHDCENISQYRDRVYKNFELYKPTITGVLHNKIYYKDASRGASIMKRNAKKIALRTFLNKTLMPAISDVFKELSLKEVKAQQKLKPAQTKQLVN
jgi:hypothetical protein